MLTNTRRSPLSLMLILLVLLSLMAFAPMINKNYAMATETSKMVDNNENYVNQNGQKIDENQVDPEELDEEKNNLEDDSKKKSKKNSSKSEGSSEKNSSDEDSNDDNDNNNENTDSDTEVIESNSDENVSMAEDNDSDTQENDSESDESADVDLDDEIVQANDSDQESNSGSDAQVNENVTDDSSDVDRASSYKVGVKEKNAKGKSNGSGSDANAGESTSGSENNNADANSDGAANASDNGSDASGSDNGNSANDSNSGKASNDSTNETAANAIEDGNSDNSDNGENGDQNNESSDANSDGATSNAKTADGFPVSYQPLLNELKAEHPNWTFVPADTGVTWKEALDEEDEGSRNLVDPSVSKKQRESSDKTYDGRWYKANRKTIAHYMDPRNFLNEKEIYQFLVQSYEEGAQSKETVEDIIDGSFMEDANPGGGYDSYAECIYDAGKEAGVNPNVLAAMIIMEQGWNGSSLVSGEKKGYKGYYNFFNIGAWTTSSMSSVERGLWYAKGEGEKKTSYGRPWNSPYKAIVGGAQFYKENYISEHQNTYYTKKYNVMNGLSVMGDHQYMTNVSGGLDEGKLVRKAYESNDDMSLTFEIPVYDDMPEKFCKLPN